MGKKPKERVYQVVSTNVTNSDPLYKVTLLHFKIKEEYYFH